MTMLGLFSNGGDEDEPEGCTAHHMKPDGRSWRLKLERERYLGYVLKQKIAYKCVHDGCEEREERWVPQDAHPGGEDPDPDSPVADWYDLMEKLEEQA